MSSAEIHTVQILVTARCMAGPPPPPSDLEDALTRYIRAHSTVWAGAPGGGRTLDSNGQTPFHILSVDTSTTVSTVTEGESDDAR